MENWMDLDTLFELTSQYRALGPLLGFLLPFIEAFLPFLPLFVFVLANANAYGFLFGFLISWGGTVAGSYTVFLLIRRYGDARVFRFLTKSERIRKLIHWVERNSFGPLFVLLCFPFTPSALVNLVAGLSNLKKKVYLITLMAGKLVMIATASFIGHDLRSLITQPERTAVVAVVILLLWLGGKQLEKRLNRRGGKGIRGIPGEKTGGGGGRQPGKKSGR